MRMAYNSSDWYWNVANSSAQVWSSARVQYVPLSDTTYLAWTATGKSPTYIPTPNQLLSVIESQWLPSVMSAGFAATSSSNPSLNDTYSFGATEMSYISGISTGIAAGKGLPGGGSTFVYSGHEWTSAEFMNFAVAVESFVYNYNLSLANMIISGSGSLPSTPVIID